MEIKKGNRMKGHGKVWFTSSESHCLHKGVTLCVSPRAVMVTESNRVTQKLRASSVHQSKQPEDATFPEDIRAQACCIWEIHSHFPTPFSNFHLTFDFLGCNSWQAESNPTISFCMFSLNIWVFHGRILSLLHPLWPSLSSPLLGKRPPNATMYLKCTMTGCYGLYGCVHPKFTVEALTPHAKMLGDGAP